MWEICSESMVTHTWCKFGQIAFSHTMPQSSEPLNCHMRSVNTCYLSSSRVIASFLSCLMGLTFSTIVNVQIILDFVPCVFFFLFPFLLPQKRKCAATHQSPSHFHPAKSYIIIWVYGFLISRYSSQDDVTDMDSEHISNRFLEDIQYVCQETFDQIIKIDNSIYLELYCEILEVLLGIIRSGIQWPFERRIKAFLLFNDVVILHPQLNWTLSIQYQIWYYILQHQEHPI